MQVIETGGHNEMCGGYAYDYKVICENNIVADVIEEIKQYTLQDNGFRRKGEFGTCDGLSGGAWGIYINHKTYISTWLGQEPNYNPEDLNKEVDYIYGIGGWYCAIDFYISTK